MRFHRSKVPFRRRYLVVPIILMVLAAVLIVRYNTIAPASSQHVARDTPPPSPYCRSGDPLEGVYNPLRFRVLSKCEVGSGIVESITLQESGDQRIYVRLDSHYAKLLAVGNSNYQNTLLILEIDSRGPSYGSGPDCRAAYHFRGALGL